MKALVLTAPCEFNYDTEFPTPEAGPGEVLIDIKACGICGSDIHGMDGRSGRRQMPIVMGHEAAGEIVAVGEEPVPLGDSIADRLLAEAVAWGEGLGARCRTETRTGASAGDQLIGVAAELGADLVVMGATVRRLSGRPFLGHTVEQVLSEADPTVVVVSVRRS